MSSVAVDNKKQHHGQSSSCLLIRLNSVQLLVPRILVAEVVDLEGLTLSSSLNREIKIFEWRGHQVPLVSATVFQQKNDSVQPSISAQSKVIVVHGVLDHERLPFYSFVASGNPRLVVVSAELLKPRDEEGNDSNASVLMPVLLGREGAQEEVFIPRVDHVENYIHGNFFFRKEGGSAPESSNS